MRVREAERRPAGYGIAWRDVLEDSAICLPFGVHLVVRWIRAAYMRLAWMRLTARERQLREAKSAGAKAGFDNGQRDGWRRGFSEGFQAGADARQEALLRELERR